jgi:YVTN family beta-propeller protein
VPGFFRRPTFGIAGSALVAFLMVCAATTQSSAASTPLRAVAGTSTGAVPIGAGLVEDLVVSPLGVVFGSNPSRNEVEVLDLRTGALESPIPVGSNPQGLDLSPDGSVLYVADRDGAQVSVIDVASRHELRRITIPLSVVNVPPRPVSVAVADNGKVLVTTAIDGGASLLEWIRSLAR